MAIGLGSATGVAAAPSSSDAGAAESRPIPEQHAAVTWTRGPYAQRCPTEVQFQAELAALGAPSSSGSVPSVAVRVDREATGWVAEIRSTTAHSQGVQRQLRSDSEQCDGIFSAAALAVMLVLEGDAAPTERAERTEARAVDDSAKPVVVPSPPPAALEHSFELGATVARGVFPQLALGGAARYALPLSARVSVSVRALYLPEQQVRRSEGALGLSLLGLGAEVSHRFWRGDTASLLAAVEFHFGRLQVDVQPPLRAGRGALFWPWTSLALRGEQRLGSPLFLAAELSLGVPLGPLRFGVQGGPVLAEADPVTISSLLSLGVNFH